MAKIFGLNGIIRGRQGNNVFSVQNGTQVLKVYQPAVNNPRTPAQIDQRTKFALAGRMSGATPALALSGMDGANLRDKRARFVKLLTMAATTTLDGTTTRAQIALEDVVYSEGNLPSFSTPSAVTADWQGTTITNRYNIAVTIQTSAYSSLAPAGYAELYVVCLYDAETSSLDVSQVLERTTRTAGNLAVTLRTGYQHDCTVVVYQIPFERTTERSRPRNSFVGATDTNVTLSATQNLLIAEANWGRSMLVQVIPVLLPSHSMHNNPTEDDTRTVVEEALMETAVSETKRKK